MLAALGGGDEQQSAFGPRDELAVEEISRYRFVDGDVRVAHDDGVERIADARREGRTPGGAVEAGTLVTEHRGAVTDGADVVVEDAGVDRMRVLLREHR